jgi:hypothetical protein
MSLVKAEYKLQASEGQLWKFLESSKLENQELKLKLHEISIELQKVKGEHDVFLADYERLKNAPALQQKIPI